MLYDVEFNFGLVNSFIRNKFEKLNGNVKIVYFNVCLFKCCEYFVFVKEMVLENKFDIFIVFEIWFNSLVMDLEIEIFGYVIYCID